MSFLNPVNEPVLRFKSTDAGAPQINYNARTAGDVKAVLKACLVTGYGATASAGWSIVNEIDHVAEFVSPSAAMSDYRLGVDDSSVSSTTWYYQHQNSRTNPSFNSPSKTFGSINATHPDNGWQLFITAHGFVFVELVQHTAINKLSARMTYFSQIKSGLIDGTGANMMFFNVGHSATIELPEQFYLTSHPHLVIGAFTGVQMFSATPFPLGKRGYYYGAAILDISSPIYTAVIGKDLVTGEVPGILSKLTNDTASTYGVQETIIGERNAISICCGFPTGTAITAYENSRTFLIYLDYWEY